MIDDNVLKVSANSNPSSIAGAIAGVMKSEYQKRGAKATVELRAVGAGAVNQAVKSIAIARGYVASAGMNLNCIPAFSEFEVDGEDRALIKFIVRTEV